MTDEVRRCTRCILPENYPNIDFDENGVCRVCREHDVKYSGIDWDARERKLAKMMDRYRGKGRGKYDCMVPFSGGKDSTYCLWLLKSRYGMTPLAFNLDNGFAEDGAQLFVKSGADRLGVDLYTYSPSKKFLYEVYGHALRQTGEFCSACVVLIPTTIFRIADIHGIRLIAGGFSDITEAPPPEYAYMDRVCFWNIMKDRFSRKSLAWDFFFPSWKRMFGVKYFNLPDYIEWDLPMIYETLNRELDYNRSMSDIRYDCLGTPHSSYLFRRKSGFGKYEYLYSNMIRAGVIDREEALAIVMERETFELPEGFEEFVSKLGADCSILEETKDKSVFDFPGRKKGIRDLAIKIREMLP
jgi:hypothetical protein